MVEIQKPRIECIESPEDASYGKYVIEPLERGYGTTLGNSLRRVLLSSLPVTGGGESEEIHHRTAQGKLQHRNDYILSKRNLFCLLACSAVHDFFRKGIKIKVIKN